MAKKANDRYQKNLELYDQLVTTYPEIARKGKTMPYTSVNGHMFSLLGKDGHLTLRLPASDRQEFLEKYDTELSVQYGRTMKEYVVVPDVLLANTEELQPYFELSYQYTSSLKPK
jgi:hypothetical protein